VSAVEQLTFDVAAVPSADAKRRPWLESVPLSKRARYAAELCGMTGSVDERAALVAAIIWPEAVER
jgi:hypothetical protein